jgi:hypothetical protein
MRVNKFNLAADQAADLTVHGGTEKAGRGASRLRGGLVCEEAFRRRLFFPNRP